MAVIKWAPVDHDGNFLIEELEKLLTPRTKLVAITHMSNALGTVVPSKDVVKLAQARGIKGAGRWRAGRRAPAGRRAGYRLRLPRLHRGTSSTGRPGLICSMARMSSLLRCGPSMALVR